MDYEALTFAIFAYIPDVVGLIGVGLVLFAYMLLQTNKWTSKDFSFSITNFIGSVCILFSLFFHWNLSSVVIEIMWLLISAYGVWKALTCRKILQK